MWPNLEVIGWYSAKSNATGDLANDQPTSQDLEQMRTTMVELCDNPLLLIMNKQSQQAKERKLIPFFLYEQSAKFTSDS